MAYKNNCTSHVFTYAKLTLNIKTSANYTSFIMILKYETIHEKYISDSVLKKEKKKLMPRILKLKRHTFDRIYYSCKMISLGKREIGF